LADMLTLCESKIWQGVVSFEEAEYNNNDGCVRLSQWRLVESPTADRERRSGLTRN